MPNSLADTPTIETPEILQRLTGDDNAPEETDEEIMQRWYDDSKRGWFWYEDPVEEVAEEEIEEDPRWPNMADYTTKELWEMYPDDFQALIKLFRKKAVQTDTVADVKDYMKMQDIARRKAAVFANVATYVVQQTPQFNVLAAHPMNVPGNIERVRRDKSEVTGVLAQNPNDFALLVFERDNCSYCERQKNVLTYFQSRHHWNVKHINISRNPEMGERFGISITPTILLVVNGNQDYFPVSMGIATRPAIERGVVRGIAQLNGTNTPQQYTRPQHLQNGPLDYSAVLEDPTY